MGTQVGCSMRMCTHIQSNVHPGERRGVAGGCGSGHSYVGDVGAVIWGARLSSVTTNSCKHTALASGFCSKKGCEAAALHWVSAAEPSLICKGTALAAYTVAHSMTHCARWKKTSRSAMSCGLDKTWL